MFQLTYQGRSQSYQERSHGSYSDQSGASHFNDKYGTVVKPQGFQGNAQRYGGASHTNVTPSSYYQRSSTYISSPGFNALQAQESKKPNMDELLA